VDGGVSGWLEGREIDALRQLGVQRRHRRGTYLMLEGDRGDHALLVLEGRVKVLATNADGAETLIAVRGPGDLVGELNALAGSDSPRSASVCALDDVVVRSIRATELLRFLGDHPPACLRVMRQLAARVRESTVRHTDAAGYDVLHRVARALAERTDEDGPDGVDVSSGLSQRDLAGLVAGSPKSVSRALATLRSLGLVSTSRRSIVVHDIERLRKFGGRG
jgi:CRP/FNR family cyclic AMP-dependent transcriptional regulator